MDDSSGIIPPREDDLVRQIGRELIEVGFGRGGSLFTPGRSVWSVEVAQELHRHYNEQPDTGTDPFLAKLHRQLGQASDGTIQLAAELLTLQALPLTNLSPGKKRQRMSTVLGWMHEPAAIPGHVLDAFEQGTWSGGIGAHTMLWKWLADAVDLLCGWWTLPAEQRERATNDPWGWKASLAEYQVVPSLREELLYLGFPTRFLPITNVAHKKAIRSAFVEPGVPSTGDLDRDLLDITVRLQGGREEPVDYYVPPLVTRWRKQSGGPPRERRAWLVRPRPGGRERVERWVADAFVSVEASHLATMEPGASRPQVQVAVDAGYSFLDSAERARMINEYHAFLSQMDSEDIVITLLEDQLYLGVLTGDPEYGADGSSAWLRRAAGWSTTGPVATQSLAAPLVAKLDQQGTVVDLTSALAELAALLASKDSDTSTAGVAVERAVARLASADDRLAARLHMERSWLQEVIDLWRERSQIVLYGPPGTGKTYLARALAAHVAERDAVRLVQFHPSYAYEDFFEGFRPVEGSEGAVSFARMPGPLRQIAAAAAADAGRPYVLIIDEINRANLAKVFGELYYLLEYRDATVRLQYSPTETFSLPSNVFIVGTMNTADRSIALVDAAIRRRFAFIELHPDRPPVRDVLSRWLAEQGRNGDHRADLLAALNAAIDDEDHDFKIGPSYLMRPHLDTEAALERVWRHDLMPLLEEHYQGRLSRAQILARFGLAAVRARIVRPASDHAGGPDEAPER